MAVILTSILLIQSLFRNSINADIPLALVSAVSVGGRQPRWSSENGNKKLVKIAWLATHPLVYHFNASTSLGALAYSINTLENDSSLLPGYTFDVRHRDTSCNPKQATGVILQLLENPDWQPDLILGPICSGAMAPVAKLASYLNIPVFGWVSSDPPLADKSTYTTLVRFLGAINNLGDGLVLLLRRFTWKRVFIISTRGLDYDEVGRGLREVFLAEGDITIARWERGVQESPSLLTIQDVYRKVKREARIVILCIPNTEIRLWALAAYQSNMYGGEYVFIYINQQITEPDLYDFILSVDFYLRGDDDDDRVKLALSNFFVMLAKTENFYYTGSFIDKFWKAANENKWRERFPGVPPAQPDFYSLFLYDALRVYSRFATETGTINNGTAIFRAASGSFTPGGATGNVILDDACDRIPDFHVFRMTATKLFDVVARTLSTLDGTRINRKLDITGDIIWGDGRVGPKFAPPDTPACGFDNENCPPLTLYIVPAVILTLLLLVTFSVSLGYRKVRYELHLANMTWKLNYTDINFYSGKPGINSSVHSRMVPLAMSRITMVQRSTTSMAMKIANYCGNVVFVKKINIFKVQLDRDVCEEMRAMQEAQHSNLNTFMGACTVAPHIVCVWDYCIKGSLQDVIWNDNIQLDDMFKFSICIDILKGLTYLHESRLQLHGRLTSANVLVDGRWTCKLTDYGLALFTLGHRPNSHDTKKLFWTAPEVLREASHDLSLGIVPETPMRGRHPAADMYSAGVVMKEVMCRNGPYTELEDRFTDKEIVYRVRAMGVEGSPEFRPPLTDIHHKLSTASDVTGSVVLCIKAMWREIPHRRCSAYKALKIISALNPFREANVVENMMNMIEKHSANLEAIVERRTLELEAEQDKTENLLNKILPKSVTEDLRSGRTVSAESFVSATVYFSDIYGFADLTGECSPLQVVDILNGLYTLFDEIIPLHDVYKVETVGDVYVLVSGLPLQNGDRHVVEICNCALDIMSGVMTFKVPHKPKHRMCIRIGVHTGAIVSGVVGQTMPRFCLFGDTMNTASRMQTHGEPMRIHISSVSQQVLSKHGGYAVEERGQVSIKGKGTMTTYWLLGKNKISLSDSHPEIELAAN